jgi:hypothetical protein
MGMIVLVDGSMGVICISSGTAIVDLEDDRQRQNGRLYDCAHPLLFPPQKKKKHPKGVVDVSFFTDPVVGALSSQLPRNGWWLKMTQTKQEADSTGYQFQQVLLTTRLQLNFSSLGRLLLLIIIYVS